VTLAARLFAAVVAIAAGCGPSTGIGSSDDDDDDLEPDARSGAVAELTGTVWAPGMAPGMVPVGHEIPIAFARVSLVSDRPAPIPSSVYCETCVDSTGAILSDAHGHFTVGTLATGNYWLVIEKGQFRREVALVVTSGHRTLDAADTTLPSAFDREHGQTIPHVAVAAGSYDSIQDILGKMGLGQIGAGGDLTNTLGEIDLYANGGADLGLAMGTLTQLVSDPARLRQYHIIFIPCASTANTAALADQQNLKNLRDYVAAGGKLYVTDWSGEWMDDVFPAPVELGGATTDTPASAYDATADTWNPALFGDADGDYYQSPDGHAVDPDLSAWLTGQIGPRSDSGGDVGPIDPDRFVVYDNWNWIKSLTAVPVGVDGDGNPIVDTPRVWVEGSGAVGAGAGPHPLSVTFNPPGCGRVLYSTYHTAPGTHLGLLPQERVLLFLILEIGVCNNNPPIGRVAPPRSRAAIDD
jgi:hypothetical protein